MTDVEINYKASKIKLIALDVDGVMTDGSITYDENGVEYKTFNTKDGQGIVSVQNAGIKTAIITARLNGTVRERFNNLKMTKLYEGQKDKEKALNDLTKEFNLTYDEIAYMGDDIPDLCVLKKVGLATCPNDAVDEVKEIVDYITSKNGGRGAVRELCDLILKNHK